ncbi:hypothetical protein N7478_012044 [Penicillium angulare]|uniref:uncharacterized protein n=1 Tax=Penicillium angulare TaxID=116970 RepID=UPI0025420536|nr:uncharacterized protein N7478_012044 [Penicillium angulare]KAJ5261449.1 hypothetical protein N7478_012044 [Penicillium angulare]
MLLVIVGLLTLLSLAWDSALSFLVEQQDPSIFSGHHPSSFSSWFTHGVNPVPCHSHNDYWRRIPLYSAVAAGCTSVEADVWLDGNELRVGHSRKTVLQSQSLRSLYLHPLLEMLEYNNPSPANLSKSGVYERRAEGSNNDPVGIFVNDPSQTLVLLIDFKKDPEQIWSLLVRQLAPLRNRGYLTHFDGSEMIHRPVTIVATGDAPFHRILESAPIRDIFFDAPLNSIIHTPDLSKKASDYTQRENDSLMISAENSYYASGDFHKIVGSLALGRLTQDQLARLQEQVKAAHARGLKIRYWGTPTWPVGLRNHIWRVLIRENVDVLNVDDLYGATRQDWQSRGWWIDL